MVLQIHISEFPEESTWIPMCELYNSYFYTIWQPVLIYFTHFGFLHYVLRSPVFWRPAGTWTAHQGWMIQIWEQSEVQGKAKGGLEGNFREDKKGLESPHMQALRELGIHVRIFWDGALPSAGVH